MRLLAAYVLTMVCSTTVALASTPKGGNAKAAADKKHIVKFDGDTIDGDLMRPDGDLMAVRPEIPMPSLVTPPSSFEQNSRRTILDAADAISPRRAQSKHATRP